MSAGPETRNEVQLRLYWPRRSRLCMSSSHDIACRVFVAVQCKIKYQSFMQLFTHSFLETNTRTAYFDGPMESSRTSGVQQPGRLVFRKLHLV